ncbi:MAG: DUF2007 domain-containing protein [Minwuiales bacterium]|nr:DUF2007 domain-containing protein [Minwuiales bacterium]
MLQLKSILEGGPARAAWCGMQELLRSNDPVLLSWVEAVLMGEGIESVVLDQFTSVIEGSIGAIPRRLMVLDEDLLRARRVLSAAGYGDDGRIPDS